MWCRGDYCRRRDLKRRRRRKGRRRGVIGRVSCPKDGKHKHLSALTLPRLTSSLPAPPFPSLSLSPPFVSHITFPSFSVLPFLFLFPSPFSPPPSPPPSDTFLGCLRWAGVFGGGGSGGGHGGGCVVGEEHDDGVMYWCSHHKYHGYQDDMYLNLYLFPLLYWQNPKKAQRTVFTRSTCIICRGCIFYFLLTLVQTFCGSVGALCWRKGQRGGGEGRGR